MASIRKEIPIDASPHEVWEALRDFAAVHERVAPGFLLDAKQDGDARIVTFANGTVARERLVDLDDAARRLAYAVVGSERLTHHNASFQVFPEGRDKSRVVWLADVLPNELAPYIEGMMDEGCTAMQRAMARVS